MSHGLLDNTSQRLKKLKLYAEHMKTHPVYMEISTNLEKEAIYKPMIPELLSTTRNTIDSNILHRYNNHLFQQLKDDLAAYFKLESLTADNIFLSLNSCDFYETLTDLFLQKDQKVLLYTTDDYNFAQESKYLNSGRVIIDYSRPLIRHFWEINEELQKEDYKIVVICAQNFDFDVLKDIIDLLSETTVLVLKTTNPVAFNFVKYSNKTIIILREFPNVMTIVEPPINIAISRKEVIDLLNNLQLAVPIDTINLENAKYFASLDNPANAPHRTVMRPAEGYNEILSNLVRENIESLIPESNNDRYSLYNIAKRLDVSPDEIMDFATGEHFLGLSEDIKNDLHAFLDSQTRFNYYSQKTTLRNLIANKLSSDNRKLNYSNIAPGPGVSGLLDSVTRTFVNDGEGYRKLFKDRALLLDMSPDSYTRVIQKKDAMTESIPLKSDFSPDLDLLLDKMQTLKPKMLLIDNPRILTGTYLDKEQLQTLIHNTPSETMLVIDESYADFALFDNDDYNSAINYIRDFPNLIILRSFSFIYALAGMRLGYAVAQETVINAIDTVRYPFDVSPFSVFLGIKMLESNEIFEKVTLKYVQDQKDFVYQRLSRMGLFYVKSSTNSILFSTPLIAEDLQEALLPYKIRVKPVKGRFVRISVNEQTQNMQLMDALETVLKESSKGDQV